MKRVFYTVRKLWINNWFFVRVECIVNYTIVWWSFTIWGQTVKEHPTMIITYNALHKDKTSVIYPFYPIDRLLFNFQCLSLLSFFSFPLHWYFRISIELTPNFYDSYDPYQCTFKFMFRKIYIWISCLLTWPWMVNDRPRTLKRHYHIKVIWVSSWDYGTYHIGDQRRLRQACAFAQSRQSLRCSIDWLMFIR